MHATATTNESPRPGRHNARFALALLGAFLLVFALLAVNPETREDWLLENMLAVAALVLATDWSFLFYKKVLGGTELLLQAAALLCLWALWSRRWGGGRHGLLALGLGVGLGLLAKATFALSLGALVLTALLTRWDRPRLAAPLTEKRIGVEAMDLQAACRTYNILMMEGRKVAAALLIERA